jgi:hypothetical protein
MNRIYRMDSVFGMQAQCIRFNLNPVSSSPAYPVHPVEKIRHPARCSPATCACNTSHKPSSNGVGA